MVRKSFDLAHFKAFIAERRCFCFGCGIQGTKIINIMENWGYENNIVAFTDNNQKNWLVYDKRNSELSYYLFRGIC